MNIITRAEARADRYYDRLAEDAWNAAERQAQAWHERYQYHGDHCKSRCYLSVKATERLTEATRSMTEAQQKHLIAEYGGETYP